MNILLRIAFNGAAYHGFQVQGAQPTICKAVQDAMQAVFLARPDVKGCSRTDAGVHALDYALSVKYETDIPMDKLPLALNQSLPPDIRVKSARLVPQDFHARYSAAGKEYRYLILNGAVDDPFMPGLYHRVPGPVDAGAMDEAAAALAGRHSFAAFCAAGGGAADTVRTVQAVRVRRRGQWVVLTIRADGFLYNMVRIIAGTLLLAGRRQPPFAVSPAAAVATVLASGNRALAGPTLPAKGLFLTRVLYPPSVFEAP